MASSSWSVFFPKVGHGMTWSSGPICGCALSRSMPVRITRMNWSRVNPAGRLPSSGLRRQVARSEGPELLTSAKKTRCIDFLRLPHKGIVTLQVRRVGMAVIAA